MNRALCFSEIFYFAPNLFLRLAKTLLQAAEQLIFLALGEGQVVVRELPILLFELSLNFVPVALDF